MLTCQVLICVCLTCVVKNQSIWQSQTFTFRNWSLAASTSLSKMGWNAACRSRTAAPRMMGNTPANCLTSKPPLSCMLNVSTDRCGASYPLYTFMWSWEEKLLGENHPECQEVLSFRNVCPSVGSHCVALWMIASTKSSISTHLVSSDSWGHH